MKLYQMKKSISNYLTYEKILNNSKLKNLFEHLQSNYPDYEFLSVYYDKTQDEVVPIVLLGSRNNELVFLSYDHGLYFIEKYNIDEFKNALLSDVNYDNYKFYKEESEIIKNKIQQDFIVLAENSNVLNYIEGE